MSSPYQPIGELKMKQLMVLLVLGMMIFYGCAGNKNDANMPNPASVYCEKNGGTLKILTDASGAQSGECTLKDGTKCDEWAFFRGECPAGNSNTQLANPASKNCVDKGGKLDIVTDASGGQRGICTLKDGTKCEEWAYMRGECPKNYEVTEVMGDSCSVDTDCETPATYKMMSRCPFTSKCLQEKCTVVCPKFIDGKYADVKVCGECPQLSAPGPNFCMDGTIVPGEKNECGCQGQPSCDSNQRVMAITQDVCEKARGHWNECGSACRNDPDAEVCTLQCVQYCECGGIAGFGCPEGYECANYIPNDSIDAMGVCTPKANV